MYYCSSCNKSSKYMTDFLYREDVCNKCTPKPTYHCTKCNKNSQDMTDFYFSIDICNECTPPKYHCIGCNKSSKYISGFIISEKFCTKCVPYGKKSLLQVLQKWPRTMMVMIIFEELFLKGLYLNILDLQEFIGLDDI